MKILLSGATGLVGGALVRALQPEGHEIVRLSRHRSTSEARDELVWGELAATQLEEVEAVVHLSGENIAARRWSKAQKKRIRDSRVDTTLELCRCLSEASRPPGVLVCASAIGFYGDRGDEICTEESAPGSGFLPEVCQAWEAACETARNSGIRVVSVRIGMVVSGSGGALAKMLLPFKFGLGGRVGSGSQYISWISEADLVGVVRHALANVDVNGPVNAVAPNPVTNLEFTRTLAGALNRPALLPIPALALRLGLGEMAADLLLASTRAVPAKLLDSGYAFEHPKLDQALRFALNVHPVSA